MIVPFNKTYCNHNPNFIYMAEILQRHVYLLMFLPVFLFTSCDKFEGDQTVPTYLSIDNVGFTTDFSSQGTEKQNIKDVWIFVNDQAIGGFEMPAKFPVLEEGISTVEIRPGIILNGISSTRADYPYFEPIILKDVNLVRDSILSFTDLETVYRSNTVFKWREEFEDPALTIISGPHSDTGIIMTDPADNPVAFLDEYSRFSGVVSLDAARPYVFLESTSGSGNNGFDLKAGDFIFLELHYKSDVDITTGMLLNQQNQYIEQRSLIGIRATQEWKKIYINFTPVVLESPGAVSFWVYFEAYRDEAREVSKIYLDNIKLLSRQNL